LDHPAFDAFVFDQGEVDMGTLFDFSYEAHSVYNIHY